MIDATHAASASVQQDNQAQKEHYIGKRRAHTDKNIMLVNENTTKVVYLGPTTPGKTHDKKMADNEQISYPPKRHAR